MKGVLSLAFGIAVSISMLGSRPASAISEQDFDAVYDAKVIPFYDGGVTGDFTGKGGVKIVYRVFESAAGESGEKGAVVIVTGRGESQLKFAEVIYDLAQQGYSVYILDNRGQGFSGRMLKDPQIGYVKDFYDYVDDLTYFIDEIVNSKPHAKRYLLTNSMGGAIGALYLARNPTMFDAAALSSPMFRIITKPYPMPIAVALADTLDALGQGKKYAPGQKPYNWFERFEQNIVTHSDARYARSRRQTEQHPETALGGPSTHWVKESLKADRRIVRAAPLITTPTLVLEALEDKVVDNAGEDLYCKRAPHCDKVAFPGAYHELLMERDDTRSRAMGAILDYFARH